MKKTRICKLAFVAAILFISNVSQATIWRVNGNSTQTNGADYGGTAAYPVFSTIVAAAGSNLVAAGDTIHVEGSTIVYGSFAITKKLTIIGPGYFLDSNTNASNNGLEARVNGVTCSPGSDNSTIIGLHVIYPSGLGTVYVNANNITIKRCRIDVAIDLYQNIHDIYLLQNFFSDINTSTAVYLDNAIYGVPSNLVIDNNIFKCSLILPVSNATYTIQECDNNTFDGPAISGGPSIAILVNNFQNNILRTTGANVSINSGTNNNVTYCTSASGQFGTGTGNVTVSNMSFGGGYFTGGSEDGKYQLVPGTAAGSDGYDRGAFGGAIPSKRYALSGLAAIPVTYSVSSSGVASPTTGLPVTIKARTIK